MATEESRNKKEKRRFCSQQRAVKTGQMITNLTQSVDIIEEKNTIIKYF